MRDVNGFEPVLKGLNEKVSKKMIIRDASIDSYPNLDSFHNSCDFSELFPRNIESIIVITPSTIDT
jgi:hypothetical protein